VPDPGNEFFWYPHEMVDLADLAESGWFDEKTRAIFHDFTLYGPTMAAGGASPFCQVTHFSMHFVVCDL
jgi:hypothetical protein